MLRGFEPFISTLHRFLNSSIYARFDIMSYTQRLTTGTTLKKKTWFLFTTLIPAIYSLEKGNLWGPGRTVEPLQAPHQESDHHSFSSYSFYRITEYSQPDITGLTGVPIFITGIPVTSGPILLNQQAQATGIWFHSWRFFSFLSPQDAAYHFRTPVF